MMRWGLIFLACPLPLNEEQKQALMLAAARAWFEDLSPMTLDWEELRGELRVSSEVVSLGSFIGQGFEAEVHTPTASGTVRFLVTEAQLQALGGEVAEA
jgi:hypothetical protein